MGTEGRQDRAGDEGMSPIWSSAAPPPRGQRLTPGRVALAVIRCIALAALVYGCLLVFWLVRLVEWPLGVRSVTPRITQFVCRNAFRVLGIGYTVRGRPMRERGAVVANHSSWLDIFTLNAPQRIFFVSKAEVANWPGIGILARSTGTVFIERRRGHAARQKQVFLERLKRGDKLLFFPEGTSTDSIRILPFKSTLFAAFFEDEVAHEMWVQPVTARYLAPPGQDPRYYGWWGDMAFVPNLGRVLATLPQGRIEVLFHAPVHVSDFRDRKALARYCEDVVRRGLSGELVD